MVEQIDGGLADNADGKYVIICVDDKPENLKAIVDKFKMETTTIFLDSKRKAKSGK